MLKNAMVILKISVSLLFIVSWNICAGAASKSPANPMLRFVLTNNPGKNEIGLNTGCTYKATPPFSNPRDPKHTRLLDGDKPRNWHTTTGINRKDQDVVFDLKNRCRIDEVAMLFDTSKKPAHVEVFVSDSSQGPWNSCGKMSKEQYADKWWRIELNNVSGRYVKLFHKLDKWGWYLREVKLYGNILASSCGKAKVRDGELVLVEDGKTYSTIVVSDQVSSRTLDAARAFQCLAKRMTDVWIPIASESQYDSKSTPIYIGDSVAVRQRGINVKQDASDGDHYIIRRGNDYLALVGNDAPEYETKFLRSSVYAVYHLFEKLGCGWFGADPLWQVMPETQTLSIPPLKINERPAFLSRRSWMHRMKSEELRDAWRQGGASMGRYHAYKLLVPPKKYKKAHPDWFGKGQPDITNPEVIKVVIAQLRQKLDKISAPIVVPFSFSSNDNGGYVVNQRTRRIGNISTQQLYFANEVAKGLNKTHPGRFHLDCLAYWHSHKPPKPMLKAEPGVRIRIVNEGNHTRPVNMPETAKAASRGRSNTREVKAIEGWRKTGALVGIYEWHIPACGHKIWADMPWQPGEVSLENLRYWYSKGIRLVKYETKSEKNGGLPLRWPVYYQCHRGMWNPQLTAKEIMTEACGKLFGPAAQAMMNYYAVFEEAMLKTDEYVGNWHLPSPEKVYTPVVERQADKWIKIAEETAASCDNSKIKKRIAQEMALWKTAKSGLKKLRQEKRKKYVIVVDGKAMNYKRSTVSRKTLVSLYGFADDVKIDVIEQDGQNRRLRDKEKISLAHGVVFKTVK
jgi:hypothetical protein